MTKGDIKQLPVLTVGQIVQVIAALIGIAITMPVLMYAYGQSVALLEQFFSFGAADILAKTSLGIAMLIMIFFARPRSKYLRAMLAVTTGSVLAYAVYGAITETLALGDTFIYMIGSFIGLTETFEAKLPERNVQPASQLHQTPGTKLTTDKL